MDSKKTFSKQRRRGDRQEKENNIHRQGRSRWMKRGQKLAGPECFWVPVDIKVTPKKRQRGPTGKEHKKHLRRKSALGEVRGGGR